MDDEIKEELEEEVEPKTMDVVEIQAVSECYSAYDAGYNAMTVERLINVLRGFRRDARVILSFDNGYTYMGLDDCSIESKTVEEDD